jgi:hypothetical protein
VLSRKAERSVVKYRNMYVVQTFFFLFRVVDSRGHSGAQLQSQLLGRLRQEDWWGPESKESWANIVRFHLEGREWREGRGKGSEGRRNERRKGREEKNGF